MDYINVQGYGQIMKINGSILGGITNGHHPDSTEIQRLRRDLREEQERVQRLSAQLTTNVRKDVLKLLLKEHLNL